MLFNTPEIRSRLHGIVNRLAPPPLREDLIQEAMVHLWRAEEQDPGRDTAWYLRGCRLHLQNVLRLGRSVDSLKHFRSQVFDGAGTVELFSRMVPDESSWDEVSVNDFITRLIEWLTPPERGTLHCLMDGLSARESGQRLGISHTMVNRHRSRIVNLALKLGIAPSRNRPRRGP